MSEDIKESLTLEMQGSSVMITGEASVGSLLGMTDALLLLVAEQTGLDVNEVLDNFKEVEGE